MSSLWGLVPRFARQQVQRSTKLVATLGPASSSPAVFNKIIDAGVDVVRLNFSHGSHAEHLESIKLVRTAEHAAGRPIGILMDLCGPKIRTTPLAPEMEGRPIRLDRGASLTIVSRDDVPSAPGIIGSIYHNLAKDVRVGHRILLSDGLMELSVDSIDGDTLRCTVKHGGMLKGSQGINVPDSIVTAESVTAKDLADLAFGLKHDVDIVAVSFVKNAQDIRAVRRAMQETGVVRPIVAKIELPEAIKNINSILEETDGVMVARGDLGVELEAEDVPIAQKQIVLAANKEAKPVIVATQMLESMITNPRPTRAEVSDVSNAMFDGADAVMLSGETSVGAFPADSLAMMSRIACSTERNRGVDHSMVVQAMSQEQATGTLVAQPSRAVARGAVAMAETLGARALIAITRSGLSARLLSACRPSMPVIAITMDKTVCRQLLLSHGVLPCLHPTQLTTLKDFEALVKDACATAGVAGAGDAVVLTGGLPMSAPFMPTNFVKVLHIGEKEQDPKQAN